MGCFRFLFVTNKICTSLDYSGYLYLKFQINEKVFKKVKCGDAPQGNGSVSNVKCGDSRHSQGKEPDAFSLVHSVKFSS